MILRRHKKKQGQPATKNEVKEESLNLGDLTNKELKSLLDEKGVEYDKKATKKELLTLLERA